MKIEGKELDQKQIDSILNQHRNNLVIASAGSGKTTTIIGKVKYLVDSKEVKSFEILCLSFTNKSAYEMKSRVEKEINKDIDIFTFHKLGITIIEKSGLNKEYLIDSEVLVSKLLGILLNEKEFLHNFLYYIYGKNKVEENLFLLDYYSINKYGIEFTEYINLIKQERYSIEELKNKSNNKKYQLFLKILIPVYYEYQEYLNKNNLIDFNDMITLSTELIRNNKVKLLYKYIIIDEYQDMSTSRFLLIKEIYDKNNTKLFCVGDDYQCIFSYAGSKLDFFLHFEKYFGNFHLNIINKTYRFNQLIADLSNKFITKNKKQFKKDIDSIHKDNELSLEIIDIDHLVDELIKLPSYSKIYFLGRYKHDLKMLEDTDLFHIEQKEEVILYFKRRIDFDIRFFTVHQSKGLESDYVFIINNKKGKSGFPSEKKDNDIKKILFPRKDFLEEERRLYYVALTRAKRKTILIAHENNESMFLKEMKKYLKKK